MKFVSIEKVLQIGLLWIGLTSVSGFKFQRLSEFEEKVAKSSCAFALNLLKHVESKYNSSNIVFSPASINIMLSILQQGAKGKTAEELEKVLGLTAEESIRGYRNLLGLKKEKNITLEWGNRCYVRPELEINEEYEKLIQNHFDVGLEKMNFGIPTAQDSAEKINKWVEDVTRGYIRNLVDSGSLTPETIMVMINAIFFKGNWAKPYKKGKTSVDKFESDSKESIQTFFMSQREKYYSDKDSSIGAKWVQQPFQNERFSMVFVLPTKRHHLSQLIKKLTADHLYTMFNQLRVSHVKLRIPKFKISEKVSLIQTLQELGLNDLFSPESDLSGVLKTGNGLFVSDMIHEANVEIDEKGGTGSAATVVQFLRTSTPTMTFVADQPFLFFIIDENTNIPLFAGKIVNPRT